jgi:hypothetical protein
MAGNVHASCAQGIDAVVTPQIQSNTALKAACAITTANRPDPPSRGDDSVRAAGANGAQGPRPPLAAGAPTGEQRAPAAQSPRAQVAPFQVVATGV